MMAIGERIVPTGHIETNKEVLDTALGTRTFLVGKFGLADGHIIGRSCYEIFREIGAELKELHRRAQAGEAIRKDEDRFVRADGGVQWLRGEMRPWQEPDGALHGYRGLDHEVSPRRRRTRRRCAMHTSACAP